MRFQAGEGQARTASTQLRRRKLTKPEAHGCDEAAKIDMPR